MKIEPNDCGYEKNIKLENYSAKLSLFLIFFNLDFFDVSVLGFYGPSFINNYCVN